MARYYKHLMASTRQKWYKLQMAFCQDNHMECYHGKKINSQHENPSFADLPRQLAIQQTWPEVILWSYQYSTQQLQWRHNGRDSVSNHQPHDCLLNRLFRRRSKKTSRLRTTGLCAGISPGTGEFPAQMASYAENVSIWWRHHDNFTLE